MQRTIQNLSARTVVRVSASSILSGRMPRPRGHVHSYTSPPPAPLSPGLLLPAVRSAPGDVPCLAELKLFIPPARASWPEPGGLPAPCGGGGAVLAPVPAAPVAAYPDVIQTDHSQCPGPNTQGLHLP